MHAAEALWRAADPGGAGHTRTVHLSEFDVHLNENMDVSRPSKRKYGRGQVESAHVQAAEALRRAADPGGAGLFELASAFILRELPHHMVRDPSSRS